MLPGLVFTADISWRVDDDLDVRSPWMVLKITQSPKKASENITTPAIPALPLHRLDRDRPLLSPQRRPPRAPSPCLPTSFPESSPPSRWSNGAISAMSCISACVLWQGCRLRAVGPFLSSSPAERFSVGPWKLGHVDPCFCRGHHRGRGGRHVWSAACLAL